MFTYPASEVTKFFYGFNRPFYERAGWQAWHDKEGRTVIMANALGVSPQDITIEVVGREDGSQILSVKGATKQEESGRDFSIEFAWLVNPVKKVTKAFRDGLIILTLEYKAPQKAEVEIVDA